MLTSSNYNYEFSNVIRNKRRNEEILSEGYDKSSDSYMFPSGSFNNFSDAVIKENLFRRLGTVLHAPTREGLIQTVFSTANAAIVNEATAFPEDNDSFDKASFSSYKVAAVSKLNIRFIEDMHFNVEKYLTNEFVRRFGRAEEQVFINGTGISEPSGLLMTAETGRSIDTTESLSYDDIIALYFVTKPEFRKNGVCSARNACLKSVCFPSINFCKFSSLSSVNMFLETDMLNTSASTVSSSGSSDCCMGSPL